MITLIIVDCQYDFIVGSLVVRNANTIIDNITSYISNNKDNIDKIVFTLDWHPINHCSFRVNGGKWPVHCVQYSMGASINSKLFDTVKRLGIPYDTILKGTDANIEEYGAFNIASFSNCLFDIAHEVPINPTADIVVCGIAGDYCVKETLNNLLELNPKVFLNGIASIDDGTTINKYIIENNLSVVE
jgi:nicotinamidase-related amidase